MRIVSDNYSIGSKFLLQLQEPRFTRSGNRQARLLSVLRICIFARFLVVPGRVRWGCEALLQRPCELTGASENDEWKYCWRSASRGSELTAVHTLWVWVQTPPLHLRASSWLKCLKEQSRQLNSFLPFHSKSISHCLCLQQWNVTAPIVFMGLMVYSREDPVLSV